MLLAKDAPSVSLEMFKTPELQLALLGAGTRSPEVPASLSNAATPSSIFYFLFPLQKVGLLSLKDFSLSSKWEARRQTPSRRQPPPGRNSPARTARLGERRRNRACSQGYFTEVRWECSVNLIIYTPLIRKGHAYLQAVRTCLNKQPP